MSWRIDECGRRGVDVRLGVAADVDAVLALEPDAVIVATGCRADVATHSKWKHPFLESPAATRTGSSPSTPWSPTRRSRGHKVVVLDAVGDIQAITGAAELLASGGREVLALTPLP